ncbi:MAG: class I SAM-dependent methyltransferase [Bacteroidales bacterium]|nr:class I SAM-dependent methyltransferase [Bacteroidales bacterium]
MDGIKSSPGESFIAAESRRMELLADKSRVRVDDCGTGKGGYRRVCRIVRSAAVGRKYGLLLAYFAARAGEGPIIEMGTSLGISTFYLALSNRKAHILTIEGCSSIAGIALEGFRKQGLENIEPIVGNFDVHLDEVAGKQPGPGLVFIDGNHRGDALMRYFRSVAGVAGHDTVLIADDIDYSLSMARAWRTLRSDARVSESIDMGRMGIVFFRRYKSGIHYRIRY